MAVFFTQFSPVSLGRHCLYSKLTWCFACTLLSVRNACLFALSVFLHIIAGDIKWILLFVIVMTSTQNIKTLRQLCEVMQRRKQH